MGRASEIATLDERLSYLGRLQGSMLVIEGEAGIGKSRLLTEFIQRANSRRVRNVVTAECSYAVQRPFHPIGRFIGASYAAMSHQTIPASVLRALAQVAPHEMSSVGTFEPKPSVTLERLDLFAALSWYVKSASYNRATIFAIEDLHWADRSTCDFLAYLAAHLLSSRLLIIATYRSDELKESSEPSAGLQRLLQSAFVQRIHLSPLSRKEIAALIRDMPEARVALAPEAVADISERCDGNPFFAEELVKGIESEDGAPTALPVSIRASISRRLNALTPADRRILSYASVLGQRFDPDILARALTCPVEELLPALRRARDANIIVEDDGRRPLCRFRHALTRQTICQDMLAFELRAFHARIVEIIEALENVDTYVGELAYHAFEARDQRRSLLYNERAGESAFAARALAEALVCFKRALSVASDTIDQVRLIERLGTSLRLQGESLPALEHFDSAVKLRLARGEFDDAARLAGLIVAEDNNIGRTKPYAYGERFVGQHGALITAAAREELLLVMAQGAVQTEDVASAQRFIDMLPEPHMLPADRRLTYIRVQLWCNAYAGELDRWKACAIILEDHVLTLPPFAAVTTLCGIAQTATLIGAQAEATRALAHGERIASQWGFHTLRAFLAVLKAMHLYTSGQLVEAKFSVEFALENGEAYLPRANALPLGILIALSLGDEPLAQRCLGERISRFSHEQPTANDSAFLLAAETLWFSSKGKASRSASDLIAKINDTMVTTHLGTIILYAAAISLPEDALIQFAENRYVTCKHPDSAVARACMSLIEAVVARRKGDASEAHRLASLAAVEYRGLQWPLLEAKALAIAGEREQALDIYERCGAAGDIRRLAPPAVGTVRGDETRLSKREREVAELISSGLTNGEIANTLCISAKTVEKHISSILDRLTLRSRTQIALALHGNSSQGEAGRASLDRHGSH